MAQMRLGRRWVHLSRTPGLPPHFAPPRANRDAHDFRPRCALGFLPPLVAPPYAVLPKYEVRLTATISPHGRHERKRALMYLRSPRLPSLRVKVHDQYVPAAAGTVHHSVSKSLAPHKCHETCVVSERGTRVSYTLEHLDTLKFITACVLRNVPHSVRPGGVQRSPRPSAPSGEQCGHVG